MTAYINELRDVIRRLHGAEPTHVESVPVTETFGGETVWDGIVEVFDLRGHPKANRVYAWSHDTDDPQNPQNPKRHVTVLHIPPVTSAVMAVKAAIVEEFRSGEPTAEEA